MPKILKKPSGGPKSRTSFFLDDLETVLVKVHDCVLIQAPAETRLPYVGRVKKITQLSGDPNDIECLVSWFYRPEEARGGRKSFHGERELFSSDHEDLAHKTTMMSKCSVLTLDEYEQLKEYDTTDFFTRFLYKAQTKTYEPDDVPVFCTCEMPYNPDQLMLCCDSCQEWYHPECLGMPSTAIDEQKGQFYCTDCTATGAAVSAHSPPGAQAGAQHGDAQNNNNGWYAAAGPAGQQSGQQSGQAQEDSAAAADTRYHEAHVEQQLLMQALQHPHLQHPPPLQQQQQQQHHYDDDLLHEQQVLAQQLFALQQQQQQQQGHALNRLVGNGYQQQHMYNTSLCPE